MVTAFQPFRTPIERAAARICSRPATGRELHAVHRGAGGGGLVEHGPTAAGDVDLIAALMCGHNLTDTPPETRSVV